MKKLAKKTWFITIVSIGCIYSAGVIANNVWNPSGSLGSVAQGDLAISITGTGSNNCQSGGSGGSTTFQLYTGSVCGSTNGSVSQNYATATTVEFNNGQVRSVPFGAVTTIVNNLGTQPVSPADLTLCSGAPGCSISIIVISAASANCFTANPCFSLSCPTSSTCVGSRSNGIMLVTLS